jgi:hypothetical protein
MEIHNHNMQELNLHEQHCNIAVFMKSMINMGISFYNTVSDQIKFRKNFSALKKELKSFLFEDSFYPTDEFMLFYKDTVFLLLLIFCMWDCVLYVIFHSCILFVMLTQSVHVVRHHSIVVLLYDMHIILKCSY